MRVLFTLAVAVALFTGSNLFAEEAAKPANPVVKREANVAIKSSEISRIWVTPEYYGAFTKNPNYPNFPLVTMGANPGVDPNSGALGFPGTTILFDKEKADLDFHHGFKLAAGGWIDEERKFGAEVSGFWLPQQSERHTISQDGVNRLAIPFYDTTAEFLIPGAPSFEDRIAYEPGQWTVASIRIGNRQEFWGAGTHAIVSVMRKDSLTIDFKAGFRYLSLKDQFTFKQTLTDAVDGTFRNFANESFSVDGATYTSNDTFSGNNKFYGLDVGARFVLKKGRFGAEILPSVAVGGTRQTVDIKGVSTATLASIGYHSVFNSGGFWAQDTNIGTHNQTVLSVVPEINVKGTYDVNKHITVSVGYSILYWNSVVNGGDHVDRKINADKVPVGGIGLPFGGFQNFPATPTFKFKETDFWAHGVNVGFTLKF